MVSSMSGVMPQLPTGAYSPAKAALIMLTEMMAMEWAPDGIRANAVCPGFVHTSMTEAIYSQPKLARERAWMVPLGRIAKRRPTSPTSSPSCSSPAASYITAQALVVDGGLTRSILNHAPGVAAHPERKVDESVAVLSAEHRQPRRDRGRHGRHEPDFYQRMLKELTEQIKLGDELGYDSVSFTEHHFHIEGFELSNNPVLLDLYFAMQTKRIRVGQLGIVLPASNPIRVAEDIAMLDHMTGGRANAGFARGYQRRWVDVMAQQTHGIHGALPNQHDEIDNANRAGLRGELPHHQEMLDRGDADLRRQVLEGAGRRRRRGRSTPRRSGARASRTAS